MGRRGGEKGRRDGEATVEEKREEGEDRISAEVQYKCTYTHPSISLVPGPAQLSVACSTEKR